MKRELAHTLNAIVLLGVLLTGCSLLTGTKLTSDRLPADVWIATTRSAITHRLVVWGGSTPDRCASLYSEKRRVYNVTPCRHIALSTNAGESLWLAPVGDGKLLVGTEARDTCEEIRGRVGACQRVTVVDAN